MQFLFTLPLGFMCEKKNNGMRERGAADRHIKERETLNERDGQRTKGRRPRRFSTREKAASFGSRFFKQQQRG